MVGKVIGGSLRLRSSASTSGSIVTSIPDGSTVEVNLCGNQQWFRAVYSGYSGYVMSRYIHVTGGGTNATITTSTDPLNIRELPSTSSSILFTAPKGMSVKVLESASGFYRISCSLGTGWGSTQYITQGGGTGGGDSSGSGLYVGHFCRVTKNSVKIYSDEARTKYTGYVHKDARFIVKSIKKDASGGYYSIGIQWGGANSNTRYIRSDCVEELYVASNSAWARAITVATGFALSCKNTSATSGSYRYTEHTLDIPVGDSGGWCQRFMCFICKAAQVPSSKYPSFSDSYCSNGVAFFKNRNEYYMNKVGIPEAGDWLYTGENPGHVVFIYQANGDTLNIVEGNNSNDTLGVRTINFATATNIHGIAKPSYDQ